MSEHLSPQPNDDDLIDQAIARAASHERTITDAAARVIASQLHGGQSSALYALASAGSIDREGLAAELCRDADEFKDDPRILAQLEALNAYITTRGDDIEPRDGWHELWLREPAQIAGRSVEDWHLFLTTHEGEPSGHLETPGSRYGRTSEDCAWWAIAALAVYAEQADISDAPEETADWLMGLAVNDSDDVQAIVQEWWESVPEEVREQLTTLEKRGGYRHE